MKYHKHIIEKEILYYYDLGKKYTEINYYIIKDNTCLASTSTLHLAKLYIDSGYNKRLYYIK